MGCLRCRKLEHYLQELLDELGVAATIEVVEDVDVMLQYGVTHTPALVINGELVEDHYGMGREALKRRLRAPQPQQK